ncbi:MAG: flagellar protein FlgN [Syntrophobacterales bacterium]|nr:flagellar protein FlgN [Syntrophobacterales bacterium]
MRQLLAVLTREEEALRTAEEAEILATAREKEEILTRLAAWQPPPGSPPEEASVAPALPADLKRRVALQAARNRALLEAALEAIQEFLQLLSPPGPGLYAPEGRLYPRGGGSLVHRQA